MGLSPQGEGNLPQWLLNVVLKSRDPKLTDLAAKLMHKAWMNLTRMREKPCSAQS